MDDDFVQGQELFIQDIYTRRHNWLNNHPQTESVASGHESVASGHASTRLCKSLWWAVMYRSDTSNMFASEMNNSLL